MLKTLFLWMAPVLALGIILLSATYIRDIHRAHERVSAAGTVIASPYGDIEYTDAGSGPPVLVIHGSGGGYDQGELIAQAVLSADFHVVTPSRFGYLRSAIRENATWDEQAHAYAFLLDHLQIDKVAVVAMSHGGPSALLLALLHPERVSSLTLISCGVAPSASSDQAEANEKGEILTSIFKYDLLYWVISKFAKSQFMELMGANDEVVAGLTRSQRQVIERIIDYMNPVSLRSAGVSFDNKAKLPGERIAAIRAPTLVLHAEDDTLQLFHNAEFAASKIPDARLISFEAGGHVVMIVEQATVRPGVQRHILTHLN
ncbi:MAG: alpha/beta hydrolase [Xanthomonadales bacterium]|jgi:pimeloyl-ACP methyl ester carboxylesterase|nr:alpha/beta hydrolase [Xanthomonadales bacterium]